MWNTQIQERVREKKAGRDRGEYTHTANTSPHKQDSMRCNDAWSE